MSEMSVDYKKLLDVLDELDAVKLTEIIERAARLLKKAIEKSKIEKSKSKKKISKGTGVMPKQLVENNEWIDYVLKDAELNGWESFDMRTTKKDKLSGEKQVEVVTMMESVEKEDMYVFADTEKKMSRGQAMCYSKILKDRNDEIYETFVKMNKKGMSSEESVEKAEKEAEKKAEKAEKEAKKAEKEAKKAEKEAEKEAKKAEKEAEKGLKKAEKEAEKGLKTKVMVQVKREQTEAQEIDSPLMPALEAIPLMPVLILGATGMSMKKKVKK